jgi:hypothetical protein
MDHYIQGKCERCRTTREALDELEIELIALKGIRDIIKLIPVEHATPPYLIQRVEAHIDRLDEAFEKVFNFECKQT